MMHTFSSLSLIHLHLPLFFVFLFFFEFGVFLSLCARIVPDDGTVSLVSWCFSVTMAVMDLFVLFITSFVPPLLGSRSRVCESVERGPLFYLFIFGFHIVLVCMISHYWHSPHRNSSGNEKHGHLGRFFVHWLHMHRYTSLRYVAIFRTTLHEDYSVIRHRKWLAMVIQETAEEFTGVWVG